MDLALSAEEKSLLEQIKTDIAEIGNDRSKLIPILQLVQQKLAYLPGEAIHCGEGDNSRGLRPEVHPPRQVWPAVTAGLPEEGLPNHPGRLRHTRQPAPA